MIKKIMILAAAALIAGCAAKSEYLKDDPALENVYAAGITVRSLSVKDARKEVSDRALDPKFFEKSGSSDRVNPVLTDVQKKLIKDEVYNCTGKFGRAYDVEVALIKGEKAVRSQWPSKYESASITLVIKFSDGDTVKTYTGEASLEVKSLKATDEYLEQLYNKTLKDCVRQCFLSMKGSKAPGQEIPKQ